MFLSKSHKIKVYQKKSIINIIRFLFEIREENMQKLLPIGVRNFEEIRKKEPLHYDLNKFVMAIVEEPVYPYVDKTKEILKLAENNNFCFFFNNRNVGKSLTLSTLEAMFQRKYHETATGAPWGAKSIN